MDATTQKAKYTYYVYDFGRLHRHTVSVIIVGQTEKRYNIRIPVAINGHAPNDTMWVQKKNVALEQQSEPASWHDYTGAYWND